MYIRQTTSVHVTNDIYHLVVGLINRVYNKLSKKYETHNHNYEMIYSRVKQPTKEFAKLEDEHVK